jgi:SAM-dependent methyltransferase
MPNNAPSSVMTVNNEKMQEEEEEEEEDWSEIMTGDLLSSGFVHHDEHQEIRLVNGNTIRITSVLTLSPLDMINLSWGTHDATGHRVWMGARFFLQALGNISLTNDYLYFENKRVLELGTGTGLSGIAVSKMFPHTIQQLVLTDASESALDLCRQNCENNQVTNNVEIEALCWGDNSNVKFASSFDTVLATDVLYDIGAWEPLLKTTNTVLRDHGRLILSHVPRAALPDGDESSSLEDYLIEKAKPYNLHLVSILRPKDLSSEESFEDWEEMEQAGAAILLFEKKGSLQHDE